MHFDLCSPYRVNERTSLRVKHSSLLALGKFTRFPGDLNISRKKKNVFY